jgi:hypothetical protein
MQPQEEQPGISLWKVVQIGVFCLMMLALLLRYAVWKESHTNIPPGGDPPTHNTRTGETIFYDNNR